MSNSQTQDASEKPQQQKPQVLEEDDEFEDFPVEGTISAPHLLHPETIADKSPDWPQEEAEQAAGSAANGGNEHLWEESWDDDDAAEDFSKQLKYAISLPFIQPRVMFRLHDAFTLFCDIPLSHLSPYLPSSRASSIPRFYDFPQPSPNQC